jgi:hypothetical protein
MLGTEAQARRRALVSLVATALCAPLAALAPADATVSAAPHQREVSAESVARAGARPAGLLRNSGFRFEAQGWTLAGAARGAPAVGRWGRNGSAAAAVDATRAGAVVLRNTRPNSAVSARAGDTLVVTALVRAAEGHATGTLTVEGRHRRSLSGRAVAPFTLNDGSWHRVRTRVAVTSFTSSAVARLRVEDPRTRGRVIVDELQVHNPAVTRLRSAGFDGLRTGPLAPEAFMGTLGGTNGNEQSYEDTSVAEGSQHGRVLRTRLQAGTIVSSPAGTNGIVVLAALPRPVDQACISYQIRFDKGFDWSLGGKLPGLLGVAPGVDPGIAAGGQDAGDLGWSGRLMWVGPEAYSWAGPENMAVSYMYGPSQRERYGDVLPWGKGFRRGRWHTVMACYSMNTVGRPDGTLRAWLDGRVVLSRTSYTYRTRSDVHVTHLAWTIFRGGNTMDWAGSWDSTIDIDSVVITTR